MFEALQAMTEAHAAELAELRALGLRIARAVTDDAEAAETPEARAACVQHFAVAARVVRQCQALEARGRRALFREEAEWARRLREIEAGRLEAAEKAEKARAEARERRKSPVETRLVNFIEVFFEDDAEGYERVEEDLRTRLDDETFETEFAGVPYEDVIRTLHRDLGLPEPEFAAQDRIWAMIWNAQWTGPDDASATDPPAEPSAGYRSG